MGLARLRGHLTQKAPVNDDCSPPLSDISDEQGANMLIDLQTKAWTALQAERAKALTAPDN